MKKITFEPASIDDLPEGVQPEFIVDFHVTLPISLKEKLLEAAKNKGLGPNKIVNMAIKAF